MKKALLAVFVAALLFVATVTPVIAGIEPSPWHIDIIFIQSRLVLILQTLNLPDEIRDSLVQIDLRLASFDQNPQQNPWITPELATQGLRVIGQISGILINPQPEPPGLPQDYAVQLVSIMDRISQILFDPQPEPPGYIAQGFNVMLRISAVLFDPQPEPPGLPQDYAVQLVSIMDRISQILFDPQPEPPGYVAQGLSVLDRVSWVLFDPQPEPPGLSPDLYGPSIYVMYQVAGVIERTFLNGFDGTIPGLNALEQLSGHLVVAAVDQQPHRAAAQVNAMSRIAEQYAGF